MDAACKKTVQHYHLSDYAPLVKRLAFQLKARLPASVEADDLIQAGMIGLMDAISRYEEGFGTQFETYAVQRIRGSMLDELRSTDWLPRRIRQNMRKIESAIQLLQQRLGKPPCDAEIATQLEIPLAEYHTLLSEGEGHQLVYYEDFHDADSKEHFLDQFSGDHLNGNNPGDPLLCLLSNDFKGAVASAINALPEREQLLMSLYYEQELNLKEVGSVMGVSESRVSQLHTQAVARLRVFLNEKTWTEQA